MNKREKLIKKASVISVWGNTILAFSKITVGFWAGSLAVIGDGIDSAIDIVMSFITLVTANIIAKPPNKKYAYGYQKADLIAAKIISFLIFFAGFQLFYSTIKRLITRESFQIPHQLAIYATIFSIVGKISLSIYQKRVGEKINSPMLIANAANMKYDVWISVTVLIGLFFSRIVHLPLADTITALLISIWIIIASLKIFMENNTELMDGVNDATVYDKIFEAVSQVDGAKNPHRVRSRQISNLHMIVIDIEVDGNITLIEAHRIAHQVEARIKEKVKEIYDIVIHMEPIGNINNGEMKGISEQDI